MIELRRVKTWIIAGVLLACSPLSPLSQPTTADNHIRYYQHILQRNPRDARTYHRLGDALIRKARETGDVTYFTRAEEALGQALQLAPDNAGAWRHLAYVFYSRHQFEQAMTHAQQAIALDAADGHAWGVLGDALLEVGRYAEADDAYQRMMQIAADLHSYGRRASLKSLRGDTAGAIADLEQAVAAGRAAGAPEESIAWALWQLASEQFAVGKLRHAEARYLEALRTYPGYYRALAGLAQVRGAQKRYDEAISLYTRAVAVIPLPEYAAALGDVLTKAGRSEEARRQYDLVEYIGHLNSVNKILYSRELAYFYADHDIKPEAALELARNELTVRQDVYAHDVLAWALLKNGRLAEARAAVTEALKLGTREAKLYFHAGMIHHALGEADRARDYLTRALETNPHFHLLQAEVAQRTLRSLGRKKSATAVGTSDATR